MLTPSCTQIEDDLADLVAGDSGAIAKHADHLATCDTCRDARHEATALARRVADAGGDHVALPADELVARLLSRVDAAASPSPTPSPSTPSAIERIEAKLAKPAEPAPAPKQAATDVTPIESKKARTPKPRVPWIAAGAIAALAAGGVAVVHLKSSASDAPQPVVAPPVVADASIGALDKLERGAADALTGVELRRGDAWVPLAKDAKLAPGAQLRTDERTRVSLAMADGSRLVLDHATTLAFDPSEPRHLSLPAGRLVADIAHVDGRAATVTTPSGTIDVVGTKFAATVAPTFTSVQVVRGTVVLAVAGGGAKQDVRAGEEGTIDRGALAVAPAPALSKEVAWAELATAIAATPDEVTSGLGALRAYKPGETRDKDWNLALAKHDVKVRIVGPIARTEITETFRNDSAQQLEGVYQFPLPADAQIDGLALDNQAAPGGFLDGAFVDKERGAKIWKGVIDKASPHPQQIATNEMIWVPGKWRDPALLDWQRGGRFELKIFPIPAKGSRTIKIAYTQVVAPRGPWRQYIYPLPHSADGSTVADRFSVDVEVRGAEAGQVRAAGYALAPDPARKDVSALTLAQSGFVPRGDLVVDYRAENGDAEVRAWTFAGGAAVAPDAKLAATRNVGIDPKVIEAQQAVAADLRPTAVLALHPKLPRWTEDRPRDYVIVVDGSQSMVGERYTRATDLTAQLVAQLDRRDRATVLVCDSECRRAGDLAPPSAARATELAKFLAADVPAGSSDVVAAIRAGADELRGSTAEKWVLYIGDGYATTGFRRAADVERAIAQSTAQASIHVSTIGLGSDADDAVMAAAARGGGGAYIGWHPGERVQAIAASALESTFGAALRDATVELPAGLADVAPTVLPTIRTGDEVLVAARVTGDVKGDVVLKGMVGGEPYEHKIPLALAVSSAAGNGFVPRLWASLAIDQLERSGAGENRVKEVALSQGYGVMSKETSLLVLESQAMFDAFGVDRGQPTQKWTGEEALDEATGSSAIAQAANAPGANAPGGAVGTGDAAAAPAATAASGSGAGYGVGRGAGGSAKADAKDADVAFDKAKAEKKPDAPAPLAEPKKVATRTPAPVTVPPAPAKLQQQERAHEAAKKRAQAARKLAVDDALGGAVDSHAGMILVHREWIRVPSVAAYGGVNPAITKAIADADAALAANPNSRERHRNLVQALAYAGELDRARDIAGKWLERDRLDGQALGYQADLLGRDGQRDLALRTLAGLVDLDPDKVALHERLVRTYEAAGRLAQACSHRIAIAAIAANGSKVADQVAAAGAAERCLRGLGREQDAEIVARSLVDDAARGAAAKAATVAPVAPRATGELVVNARWDAGTDLDISIVTPDGTRVSWMGGKPDVVVTDAVSADREELALKSIKRGNYLVEIGRGKVTGSAFVPHGAVRGTLEVNLLGTRQVLPFELTGTRAVVGRISVALEERMYDEYGTPVIRNYGE